MTEESKIVTVQMDAGTQTERQSGLFCAAISEMGSRSSQQDSLFCGERDGMLLAAVCDGMGEMCIRDSFRRDLFPVSFPEKSVELCMKAQRPGPQTVPDEKYRCCNQEQKNDGDEFSEAG